MNSKHITVILLLLTVAFVATFVIYQYGGPSGSIIVPRQKIEELQQHAGDNIEVIKRQFPIIEYYDTDDSANVDWYYRDDNDIMYKLEVGADGVFTGRALIVDGPDSVHAAPISSPDIPE